MSRVKLLPAALALLLAGCAAAPGGSSGHPSAAAAGSSAQEPQAVSPVYTDWSKLTPYEPAEPLYTYYEPYQGDALIPRDDYGHLLPYIGATISLSNYITDVLPLYGLVTADGQVVTDPVYADIYTLTDFYESGARFLILLKGDAAGQGSGRDSGAGKFQLTVAATDGSWVRDFGIAGAACADATHLAVTHMDNSITILDETGETTAQFPRSALTPFLGEDFQFAWDGECSVNWVNGIGAVSEWERLQEEADYKYTCYLDIRDGSVSAQPPEGFSDTWPYEPQEEFTVEGYNYLTPATDPVTGVTYYYGSPANGKNYTDVDILDQDGQALLSVQTSSLLYAPILQAGLCSSIENNAFCYYGLSGTCVFRFPLRDNSD